MSLSSSAMFTRPRHRTLNPHTLHPLFDPHHRFTTSWLLSPPLLLSLRTTTSLYLFATLFFILGYESSHSDGVAARRFFSYFTVLSYWGLAFYFAVAAAHTASYWLTGRSLLQRWPRWAQELHGGFYSTVAVFPFIVTIIFWALLSRGAFRTRFSTWTNISQHVLNSVFAFAEIVLTRTEPLPWWHLVALVGLLALYLGLAYVTYGTQGFFVYNFLDDRIGGRGRVAGYVFAVLAATIVVFVIVRCMIKLRMWETEQKLGMGGKLTTRENMDAFTETQDGRDVELAVQMKSEPCGVTLRE
ncbi:hypothetical protein LTR16_001610 [Cryomyces antarcticus]|uniref:FAR-17a/AIG1-like protein n=1 Tax=Cryomyces antarcticus TaxID=329879 RepID=A0ABR0LZ58_9PEZI|nr:hypothetical protein LTR39_001421 [Cryomyces antarcticus]KAK5018075.1 hypothetical protein LTR60_001658 [Cryomyces antarcticus]KAK5257105.1 hypothetical protein LTR16_001610 [Cryomyces antarcticus]